MLIVPYIQISWTSPTLEEAKRVASLLLEKQLVACVHLLPIHSFFSWKEKIEEAQEVQVTFKTRGALFDAVKEVILRECSYEVPEIVALPLIQGHTPYLDWIERATTYTKNRK